MSPPLPLAQVRILWNVTRGQPWAPPNPYHRIVVRAIRDGWLRRTDGRCGFEAFKDSHVVWTEAAKQAMGPPAPTTRDDPK